MKFGTYLKKHRETLGKDSKEYSIRKVSDRIGIQPSYLSRIERGEDIPPSEEKIKLLADDLNLDPDITLALAGKISSDLKDIICKRPKLFSDLIRSLKDSPDEAVFRVVREVRDGDW